MSSFNSTERASIAASNRRLTKEIRKDVMIGYFAMLVGVLFDIALVASLVIDKVL